MLPREGNADEDRRAGATSSSWTPMQAEASRDEGLAEVDLGEKSSSPNEMPAGDSTAWQLVTRAPLEQLLKGLIISQIRAPYVLVEYGLLILLKDCLLAEHPFSTSASLSGYVDHFQSVDDVDLGWGCGWRNIQILCSFLLAEDGESREALFNGAGFVPDIPALQTWLEIAWAKGFDEPGAEYFSWAISGTRKWIGTTECAALLRSFGVRAKIVSFTALGGKRIRRDVEHNLEVSLVTPSDDEVEKESATVLGGGLQKRSGQTDTANSRGGAIICNECGGACLQGAMYRGIVKKDSELCDGCMKTASLKGGIEDGAREPRGKKQDMEVDTDIELDSETSAIRPQRLNNFPMPEERHWNLECDGCGNPLKGKRFMSVVRSDFDLCSNCMKEIEGNGTAERGLHKDYVVIEEYPAMRNSGPPEQDQKEDNDSDVAHEEDGGIDQQKESDEVEEDTSQGEVENEELPEDENFGDKQTARERGGKSLEEMATTDSIKKSTLNAAGHTPQGNGERRKAGMHGSASSGGENFHINHDHLIEWVWSYFTESSTRRYAASSHNQRDLVTMSNRSPLYFQHRGHSRTIVGIERRRKPTGISEDVYLLILDPSVSTELLVKSLRENSGWQKLIKSDVNTLKESEYQLCYADPGIAVGEELEQLKVLSSLRYSYYSK